jgi:hypothetical protein
MLTTVLIIGGTLLAIVAVIALALNLARAPEGIENETGFHYLRKSSTVRSRYYCNKNEAGPSGKTVKNRPLKEYIPAA